MASGSAVQVPEHVLVRVVDNELVLLNLESEQYYGLDEVGTLMWQAVTTAATISDALEALQKQFDVAADVLSGDLEKLLSELSARGLVELDPS
jgi:hypothetical protein